MSSLEIEWLLFILDEFFLTKSDQNLLIVGFALLPQIWRIPTKMGR